MMTEQLTSKPGDLWIDVSMPTVNELNAKYVEQYFAPSPRDPSIGQCMTRLNLSAFVRDMMVESAKAG
jgi:hypothetical protein